MKTLIIPEKKGNLKIGQYPDLHLGAKMADFNKINPLTGLYLQWDEQIKDLKQATQLMIDQDVAVAIMPGDIYDRSSNISEKLQDALKECLLSLIRANIAVIMITGNHDFPRSREYKALIARYDGIGEYLNVVSVYKASYEQVNINDEILVHCIPQCFDKDMFREELALVQKDENFKVNVLTTHIGVQGAGIDQYEHSEGWLNKIELDLNIDYVALGDYHDFIKVSDKVAYAGVLSKNRFDERNNKHGIIVYNGADDTVNFFPYQTRGMIQHVIDCKDKEPANINKELEKILLDLNDENKEKYMKIILKNISKVTQKQLDFKYILAIKKEAFYCKVEYKYVEEELAIKEENVGTSVKTSTIKSIEEEVKDVLKAIFSDEKEQEELYSFYEKNIKIVQE